ncbi:MAG: cyanophycinase, partial [Fimbriimonadaceae bacterium]|nr:cyanophycinase [Chitinophagales bacterium]
MIKYFISIFPILISKGIIFSQSYTSYFTGDTSDIETSPQKGVVLMGGA